MCACVCVGGREGGGEVERRGEGRRWEERGRCMGKGRRGRWGRRRREITFACD